MNFEGYIDELQIEVVKRVMDGLLANHKTLTGISSVASRQLFSYTVKQVQTLLYEFNSDLFDSVRLQ